jgi:hypothetical protein
MVHQLVGERLLADVARQRESATSLGGDFADQ